MPPRKLHGTIGSPMPGGRSVDSSSSGGDGTSRAISFHLSSGPSREPSFHLSTSSSVNPSFHQSSDGTPSFHASNGSSPSGLRPPSNSGTPSSLLRRNSGDDAGSPSGRRARQQQHGGGPLPSPIVGGAASSSSPHGRRSSKSSHSVSFAQSASLGQLAPPTEPAAPEGLAAAKSEAALPTEPAADDGAPPPRPPQFNFQRKGRKTWGGADSPRDASPRGELAAAAAAAERGPSRRLQSTLASSVHSPRSPPPPLVVPPAGSKSPSLRSPPKAVPSPKAAAAVARAEAAEAAAAAAAAGASAAGGARAHRLMSDEEFTERYEIMATLGRGQFAKVKRVVRRATGEAFAVKILPKNHVGNRLANLIQEFEVLKSLHHPNIIKLVEAYETPTAVLLVTELATGGELMHRVAQQGAVYSEAEVRRHIKTILEAVEYMHSLGVVHRDLKPENILLSDASADATIRIVDLGLGRFFGEGQALHTICGTHKYLAPELVRCGRGEVSGYDQAVDIWGVGLLMYIMLFGVNPFDRADTIASNNAILAGRYTFPAASAVSIEAKDLISRILRTSPEQRPSAAECLRHEWLASATLDSGIDALMHETQQALAQYNARREKERGRKSTGLRALDIGQLQRHQLPPAVASGRPAAPPPPARPAPPTWGSGIGSGSLAAAAPLSPRGSGSGSGASGSNGELTPRSAVALRGRNLVFGSQ